MILLNFEERSTRPSFVALHTKSRHCLQMMHVFWPASFLRDPNTRARDHSPIGIGALELAQQPVAALRG
jgi:hypothetical protein